MSIPLKEQAALAENYLRYLFTTNHEADSIRRVVEKELLLFAGKTHPLFYGGGAPSVAIKVEVGKPKLSISSAGGNNKEIVNAD